MVETSFDAPWIPPLPTPYIAIYWKFNGARSFGVDEIGNINGTFEDPVNLPVQGWDSETHEATGDVTSEDFDIMLRTATDFWPGIRDRIGLPIPDNGMSAPGTMFEPDGSLSVGVFEVIGHVMEGEGFHRWKLSNLTKLKRLSG